MRVAAFVCGALVAGAAARAAATSCASGWFSLDSEGTVSGFEPAPVAVDASPWAYEYCGAAVLKSCVLQAGDEVIAVEVRTVGEDACADPQSRLADNLRPGYIRYFVPARPLIRGEEHALVCDGQDTGMTVDVLAKSDSAPPATLDIGAANVRQSDGGCCGGEDYLEVEFESSSDDFLSDGGYVEIAYASGHVLVLGHAWDSLELPPTEGTISFTPVAADGERGETVRLEPDDVHWDAVYLPCGVDRRGGSLGLWLLAPLLWVRSRSRRPGRR
ncbi:MAG TPA: hypothetical protein VGB85_06860 [Nannocystis sp.]|jgi:hypothetical protein